MQKVWNKIFFQCKKRLKATLEIAYKIIKYQKSLWIIVVKISNKLYWIENKIYYLGFKEWNHIPITNAEKSLLNIIFKNVNVAWKLN